MEKYEVKFAWQLEAGDVIANIGVVQERIEVGVFNVLGVHSFVRRLSDGKIEAVKIDVVRHSHDSVVVRVAE